MVITLTENTFREEVLNAKEPVLVDFFTAWCAPCRALAPVFDAASNEIAGTKFCRINTDDCPAIAAQYGIQSVPTLILFRAGKAAKTATGTQSRQQIHRFVTE